MLAYSLHVGYIFRSKGKLMTFLGCFVFFSPFFFKQFHYCWNAEKLEKEPFLFLENDFSNRKLAFKLKKVFFLPGKNIF